MSLDRLGQGKEALAILSGELERQADIYHRGFGIRKDTIMRLLTPRPERLSKELIIPVVTLGTSVDLNRQAAFAGIQTSFYDPSRGYDIAGGITFDLPHLIWMDNGSTNMGRSVEWVRNHLPSPSEARPATQYDGIALAIVSKFQDLLQNRVIHFPGTSVEPDSAPSLFINEHGKPTLGLFHTHNSYKTFGPALSGS